MSTDAHHNQRGTTEALCVTQRADHIGLCMDCTRGTPSPVADTILANGDELAPLKQKRSVWIGVMFGGETGVNGDMVCNLPLCPAGQHSLT